MSEYDKNLTLEEAGDNYGKTRGLAVYITAQAIKEHPIDKYEKFEDIVYGVLADFVDE